jgi:hypothetical protein
MTKMVLIFVFFWRSVDRNVLMVDKLEDGLHWPHGYEWVWNAQDCV